jgi:hypothetical protein
LRRVVGRVVSKSPRQKVIQGGGEDLVPIYALGRVIVLARLLIRRREVVGIGYLSDHNGGVRDFAALALGESRHPAAFEHLRAAWDEDAVYDTGDFRAVLIRAAALHRSEVAFDWLISIIEHGTAAHADVAVEALSVYERNVKLGERVQAALAKRKHRGAKPSGKPGS